jgi:hypothetical protein
MAIIRCKRKERKGMKIVEGWKHNTLSIKCCHKVIFVNFWIFELAMWLNIVDWDEKWLNTTMLYMIYSHCMNFIDSFWIAIT